MVGREHGDLAEQPDRKRRKRDGDEEGVSIVPTDVLLLIFARLTAVELIRCGSVCVSWRSAVKTRALLLPPRTIRPWLFLPDEIEDHCWRFLDTDTGETYTIHLPGVHQKRLVGMSDHGFLVFKDELSNRLSMINPVTGATVCLPPFPVRWIRGCRLFIVSSSSHSSSEEEGTAGTGYTAVIQHAGGVFSAFAQARNLKTWDSLSFTLDHVGKFGFHIHGKKIYGLLGEFVTQRVWFYQLFASDLHDPKNFKVWDFKFYSRPWSLSDFGGSIPDHERDECEYLNDCLEICCETSYYPVMLPDSSLIVVCRATLDHRHTIIVKVYRMPVDLHGEAEIVTDIGNCSLFLDDYNSMVLSTLEFPELKANTIYFHTDCRKANNAGVGCSPVKEGFAMFDLVAQHFVEYCPSSMDYLEYLVAKWFMPAF